MTASQTMTVRAEFEAWADSQVIGNDPEHDRYPRNDAWEAWQAAIASQAARIAELERDAERYRWLRGHGVIFDEGRPGDGARRNFGIGLDGAIDRARSASSGAEKPCAGEP